MMRETRATQTDLELRGTDGRTVVGIAVPFDTPATVHSIDGDYTEVFKRGAFTRTIRERGSKIKFLAMHDRRSLPLGRATTLREDASGLYVEARVSQTTAGDEALELIRDGALDGLSIAFEPVPSRDRWNRQHTAVERHEVKLFEISAVSFPVFESAQILGVRGSGITHIPIDDAVRKLREIEARMKGPRP
jgi:HK97 family phage prohead protease